MAENCFYCFCIPVIYEYKKHISLASVADG
jgi:hypothetical protein